MSYLSLDKEGIKNYLNQYGFSDETGLAIASMIECGLHQSLQCTLLSITHRFKNNFEKEEAYEDMPLSYRRINSHITDLDYIENVEFKYKITNEICLISYELGVLHARLRKIYFDCKNRDKNIEKEEAEEKT